MVGHVEKEGPKKKPLLSLEVRSSWLARLPKCSISKPSTIIGLSGSSPVKLLKTMSGQFTR